MNADTARAAATGRRPGLPPAGTGLPQAGPGPYGLPRNYRVLLSQLPLAITSLVVAAILFAIDPVLAAHRLFVFGFSGVLLLAALAVVLPWDRMPPWCGCMMPLLDFIPIGAMVHGASTSLSGISLLSLFPILWLAWSDIAPLATRLVAFLGPLAIVWSPFIFGTLAPSRAGMLKPLLVPLIMLGLATAATVVTKRLAAQARELMATSATARRRAMQLDTILNVADVGVVVVDEHGNDVLMNTLQRSIHRLAVPPGNPDPTEAELLVFGADRTTPVRPGRRPVRRAIDGEEFSGHLYWLGTGPDQRAMATSVRQIIDDSGEGRGAVIVFHDVTEVMEAVAAQEVLVSSVSHELRTPLTSILGYLDLVLEESVDPAMVRYLGVAQRNAERLLLLVNDLLGTSHGAMAVVRSPGQLQEVLAAAVAAAQPRARERGVELRLVTAPAMDGSFDAVRMAQAVDNLISNAVKFSPPGGLVEVCGRMEGAGMVVSVRDQGAGMSPEESARLFTRFYRTEAARRAAIPGVGLGLAITKGIVAAHGGAIDVDSKPGGGSTFTIRIPAGTAAPAIR